MPRGGDGGLGEVRRGWVASGAGTITDEMLEPPQSKLESRPQNKAAYVWR